jgi:hypothetical protein
MQLYKQDGIDPVPITRREAKEWVKRIREALRGFEHGIDTDDPKAMVEYAHEAGACGAELENIADTTKQMEGDEE